VDLHLQVCACFAPLLELGTVIADLISAAIVSADHHVDIAQRAPVAKGAVEGADDLVRDRGAVGFDNFASTVNGLASGCAGGGLPGASLPPGGVGRAPLSMRA